MVPVILVGAPGTVSEPEGPTPALGLCPPLEATELAPAEVPAEEAGVVGDDEPQADSPSMSSIKPVANSTLQCRAGIAFWTDPIAMGER
jgi:hypothetical protein